MKSDGKAKYKSSGPNMSSVEHYGTTFKSRNTNLTAGTSHEPVELLRECGT